MAGLLDDDVKMAAASSDEEGGTEVRQRAQTQRQALPRPEGTYALRRTRRRQEQEQEPAKRGGAYPLSSHSMPRVLPVAVNASGTL